MPDRTETDAPRVAERGREKEVIKRRLGALVADSPPIRAFIEQSLNRFNGQPGVSGSFDLLDDLMEHQCYRLAHWRVALDEINYRRFFDINDLAALSMERPEVFEATHALLLRLLVQGNVDGLRIDHPDGLYDPAGYLWRLQEQYALACAQQIVATDPAFRALDWHEVEGALRDALTGDLTRAASGALRWPLYVVVEKILGAGEPLPDGWAVDGTSGYDFINMTNGLFVEGRNADAFTRLYRELTQDTRRFPEVAYQKKLLILDASLASELRMLTHQLDQLAQKSRASRDFTFNTLRAALREVIACFPVYRSYIRDDEGVHEMDRRHVDMAIRRAVARNPLMSRRVVRFIRDMILLESPDTFTVEDRAEQRRFAGKFQQVTAPVTAKGVEDTAFYVYNRLVSLNEVGGEPSRFGIGPESVHRYYHERQAKWPYALSPLSTHDTKRSEDVRARINVLSELPEEWEACVTRWIRLNEPFHIRLDDPAVPDPNEEYLLYQTLVGAWPLAPFAPDTYDSFVQRIQAYLEKALHEGKVHTSWINPNEEYDAAVRAFVARVLDRDANGPFLDDLERFQRRVSDYGLFNALSQTLLKLTCAGVPDTYQGTETWDFSLVDPDNRRPVDYERLRGMLDAVGSVAMAAVGSRCEFARSLVTSREDGRIKMYVTTQSLQCRRDHPGLFTVGDYHPLDSVGEHAEHVFSFARQAGGVWAIVAVPRLVTRLSSNLDAAPLGGNVWKDTRIELPTMPPALQWENCFTGERLEPSNHEGLLSLAAADVFKHFPVALVLGRPSSRTER